MLFKYRGAFSVGDEIGVCQIIEVDLEVIGKSLFFIRAFHVKEEVKPMIDKESRFSKTGHVSILFIRCAHSQKEFKFTKNHY